MSLDAAQRSPWRALGEPEVVRGAELSAILLRWRAAYVADRPTFHGATGKLFGRDWGSPTERFMGPTQWLAQETGMHERQIQRLIHGQQKYVGLGKADAVLTALGNGVTVNDLEVIPNPNWSSERWHAYMAERGCA